MTARQISVTINGKAYTGEAEPNLLLSDFIRHVAGLTGLHVGCEHGVCGACSVLLRMPDPAADPADAAGEAHSGPWAGWESVRACLMFASQVDGCEFMTVEGLAPSETELHPLQEAFLANSGLQCGFCTPGFLTSLIPFLRDNPDPDESEVREALSGNLCRCTGYTQIVNAVLDAAQRLRQREYVTRP